MVMSMKQSKNISEKRKAKERKLWRNVFIVSLIAVIVSLLLLGCIAFFLSVVFAIMAYGQYDSLKPIEDYGETPWWYFGL